MEEFKIRDKNTGMVVTVRGEAPPPVEALPKIFGAAQRSAQQKLAEGTFKFDENFNELDKDTTRQRVANLSAQAIGVSPEDVDVDSGMGLWERTKLDLLRDEESKMEYLEKKFGSENVNMLNIGGKSKMFFRDPKSKKMTMVDEMGASLADFTADIAGEALTTAGAVGGAIVGSALGPGGTIAGATAGAALGGFGTGVAQDVVSEVATGQDVDLGEITKQRGVEAAIGVPIDLATLGVGRIFSRAAAGRVGREAVRKEFDTAFETVLKSDAAQRAGLRLSDIEALRTPGTSQVASRVAAAKPRSKIAQNMQDFREQLDLLRQISTGQNVQGQLASRFADTAESVAQSYRNVVDDIAKFDAQAAKEIEQGLSKKMQKMVAPVVSPEETGQLARDLIAPGVQKIEAENIANFEELKRLGADKMVPIKTVRNAIEDARREFIRLDDPDSAKVLTELKNRVQGGEQAISFNEFREVIDEIADSVSKSKVAGFSTGERVATRVLDNLRRVRDQLGAQDPELGMALDKALNFYKANLLDTKRGAIGRSFREQLADPAMQPSQVSTLIISDPANVRQALRIAEQGSPEAARQLKSNLQDLYLNRIGLFDRFDAKQSFSFNEDIVRELFGDRMVRDLLNLKKRIQQAKGVKTATLQRDEVYDLLSAFSGDEKDRIMQNIVKRSKSEERLNKMLNTQLLKKLQPKKGAGGQWLEPEMTGFSLAKFADNFVDADVTQVQRAMKLLKEQGDEKGLEAFRQAYKGSLFNNFSSGAQLDRFGNPTWNPMTMNQAISGQKPLRQKMNIILGPDQAEEVFALNKLALEAMEARGVSADSIFQPRYSLTDGGIQFYGVGNLIGGLRGAAWAMALRSKKATQMAQFFFSDASDEATSRQLQKFLPALIASPRGLEAIGTEATYNPQVIEQMSPLFSAPEAVEE